MKKILVITMFLLTINAFGQQIGESLLKRIGVTEENIEIILKINEETQLVIREAQLELNLYKAQLERLLFPIDVELDDVEDVLRKSLEWKLKSEFATIASRVQIRKLIGDEKYKKVLQALRAAQRNNQDNAAQQNRN